MPQIKMTIKKNASTDELTLHTPVGDNVIDLSKLDSSQSQQLLYLVNNWLFKEE